eukprot:gene10475-11606_t
MAEQLSETVKVREIFSILTQGVEINHYQVHRKSLKSVVNKHILWLDADIFRICIDKARLTTSDRIKGKIPPGLYLRDISEVRPGNQSFHFSMNSSHQANGDLCLSLIGSEDTLSLEFPSSFTRNWFLERFALLVDDITEEDEKISQRYRLSRIPGPIDDRISTAASVMGSALERGIQVLHHRHSGEIMAACLSIDRTANQLVVQTPYKSFLGISSVDTMRIDLGDIAEVRPGSHSLGFVRTQSTSLHNKGVSIISSQWVFDLEIISLQARDLLAEKLYALLLLHRFQQRPALFTAVAASAPLRKPLTEPSSKGPGPLTKSDLRSQGLMPMSEI